MADSNKEIIKAAKSGDIAKVKELLTTNAALVQAREKDGSTPLHCATWKGHQETVAVLSDAGADVNAETSNEHRGTTPLSMNGHG